MDERMERILKYKNNKLGLDDTFHFHCTQCGECCFNREDIILTPKDLFRITKKLKLTIPETLCRYCDVYVGPSSRIPLVRLMPVGSQKKCPLLKKRKCTVHDVKPTVCGLFPLGRAAQGTNAAVHSVLATSPIEYFYTPPGCGDNSETHTVREWITAFDIPVMDNFFLDWAQLQAKLSTKLIKAESQFDTKFMEALWQSIHTYLYVKYDISKDFYPQFQDNMRQLSALMDMIPLKDSESP